LAQLLARVCKLVITVMMVTILRLAKIAIAAVVIPVCGWPVHEFCKGIAIRQFAGSGGRWGFIPRRGELPLGPTGF
jgi:hypothetical protein